MGNRRGALAKQLESEVKLSCGPFKLWVGSLDPFTRELSGPDCIAKTKIHVLLFPKMYPLIRCGEALMA